MSKEQDAKREALASRVARAVWTASLFDVAKPAREAAYKAADFILAREAERERPLVEALEYGMTRLAYLGDVVAVPVMARAVNSYRALDAPPQRTLAEVAKDVVGMRHHILPDGGKALLDELAEALKREEGKR